MMPYWLIKRAKIEQVRLHRFANTVIHIHMLITRLVLNRLLEEILLG